MNRHPKANNLRPRPAITQPDDPSYRLIALTQDQVTLVDTADYQYLMQWHWYAWWNKNGRRFYAVRTMSETEDPARGRVYLHRDLMGYPSGFSIDHVDQDSLNNRKYNLRVATASQNGSNRGKQRDNTSGYKGVFWSKKEGKWIASVKLNSSQNRIGTFTDRLEAAHAYDAAAKRLHGEFACVNFPDDSDIPDWTP